MEKKNLIELEIHLLQIPVSFLGNHMSGMKPLKFPIIFKTALLAAL